jgi:ribosomal-protein-alanine N-acetyltransferase
VTLDPAHPADAPDMAGVHAGAFDTPWSEADITSLLTSTGGFGLLARDAAGTATGFILARAIAGEAEILTLAVDPACRRTGIAAALLAGSVGLARAAGAMTMFLEVAEDNAAALALYATAGFSLAGRRRGYYRRSGGVRIDAQVLRLDLNSRPA